jgi:hypothetical protein
MYLRHHGVSVITLNIAEGHLRALVFVEPQFWVVKIGNLIQRVFVTK